MENRTEDFIGMVKLTETVWIDKQSIFGSVVAVKEAFTRLTTLKEAILELSENQSKTIGGQTINKKNLRKQINELAAQIGQITAAYALSAKNEVLRKAVNFPLSHYQLSRDEEVIELCRNVAKEAKIVEANLADYGITPAMIEQLTIFIDTYAANTQLNEKDVKQRKVYSKNLKLKVKELKDHIVNSLDKVMMIFQYSHPADYQLYLEARNSMPKRHAKNSKGEVTEEEAAILSGMVSDKADEMPIAGAIVKLVGTDYQTETDSDGEYLFDSLPAGIYTIEVSVLDYQTAQLKDQKVVAGDETIADFEMQKA